jgi:enoyl-CoA hydratase/3-hydroxyacyl-CoA dehydrogenase
MSKCYRTIKLRNEQSITWIILNRPQKMNTINPVMLEELSEAIDNLEEDKKVRCVIITGKGEKAFSAGADITELQKLTPETAAQFSMKGQQTFTKLEAISKPIVAAINGYALGGGLELALSCDFRIAVDSAELGCPEIKLGLIPAWGGTQRLPQIVGVADAKWLIMFGDSVKAKEALEMGLTDKVVLQKELKNETRTLAQRLCECSPAALKYTKCAVKSGTQNLFDSGLKKERDFFAMLFAKKETKERIEAFVSHRNKKRGRILSQNSNSLAGMKHE